MSDAVMAQLAGAIPSVLWVAFAVLVWLGVRKALLPQLGKLSSVNAAGVELRFAEKLLEDASQNAGYVAEGGAAPASERRAVVSRLDHAIDIMRDGRILWVDDHPEGNEPLIELFTKLEMVVDIARSTDEGLELLRRRSYDLVLTDMHRETEKPASTAGLTLINKIEGLRIRLPIVISAAQFDPQRGVHPAVFGYTNEPNEVVNLVIDIMERIKFGAAP